LHALLDTTFQGITDDLQHDPKNLKRLSKHQNKDTNATSPRREHLPTTWSERQYVSRQRQLTSTILGNQISSTLCGFLSLVGYVASAWLMRSSRARNLMSL